MNETLLIKVKSAIREQAFALLSETHPNVCELRNDDYSLLESQVLATIQASDELISVQTALAQLEEVLSEGPED